jgi:hypothetical protein
VQACQHFYPWDGAFLRADRALFDALAPGSTLDRFVTTAGATHLSVSADVAAICVTRSSGGFAELHVKNLEKEWAGRFRLERTKPGVVRMIARPASAEAFPAMPVVMQGLTRHVAAFSEAAWFGRWGK